ncbi:MAG: hypothetical protein RR645_01965 [Clostridium sp.]
MNKKIRKILGVSILGAMSILTLVGGSPLKVTDVSAKSNDRAYHISSKLDHIEYSVKNNYLGIKNVSQWREYINEAKKLNNNLPSGSTKDKYTRKISNVEDIINMVLRVNKLEKSMEANKAVIRNTSIWDNYTEVAKDSFLNVDTMVFRNEYIKLLDRVVIKSNEVDKIKEDYSENYNDVERKIKEADHLYSVDKAIGLSLYNEAKTLANKLQESSSKEEIINKIDKSIKNIEEEIKAQTKK